MSLRDAREALAETIQRRDAERAEQEQKEQVKQQFQKMQAKTLAQRIDEARARKQQEQSQGRGQGDAEGVAQPDFAKPEAFYGLGNQIGRKRGMGMSR